MPWLSADDPSDVSAAGGVVGEHHVAWTETANRAVASFDFYLPGERDDVLSPRRRMIGAQMIRRRTAKHDAMGRLEFGGFHAAREEVQFHVNIFEVRFVVGSRVKSRDLHEPVCKRIAREKQGDEDATKEQIRINRGAVEDAERE